MACWNGNYRSLGNRRCGASKPCDAADSRFHIFNLPGYCKTMNFSQCFIRSAAISVFLMALSLSACGKTPEGGGNAQAPAISGLLASDPALAMVQGLGLGQNLEAMSVQAASSTQTYSIVSQKLGAAATDAAVRKEIAALLPSYQPQWNRNLADAYAEFLSPDELRSMATLGKSSPHFGKFMSVRSQVSPRMQEKSSALLQKLSAAALAKVFNQTANR